MLLPEAAVVTDDEIATTVNAAFARFEEALLLSLLSAGMTPHMESVVLRGVMKVMEDLRTNPESFAKIVQAVRGPRAPALPEPTLPAPLAPPELPETPES